MRYLDSRGRRWRKQSVAVDAGAFTELMNRTERDGEESRAQSRGGSPRKAAPYDVLCCMKLNILHLTGAELTELDHF